MFSQEGILASAKVSHTKCSAALNWDAQMPMSTRPCPLLIQASLDMLPGTDPVSCTSGLPCNPACHGRHPNPEPPAQASWSPDFPSFQGQDAATIAGGPAQCPVPLYLHPSGGPVDENTRVRSSEGVLNKGLEGTSKPRYFEASSL